MFAFHASPEFEGRLNTELKWFSAEVSGILGDDLGALILGGGYGRGEGGVVFSNGREEPYNDLDLTLVLHQISPERLSRLEAPRAELARRLGIHVDFSRPLTISDVRRLPHKLMWQDLLRGHQTLAGDPSLFERLAPPILHSPLPVIEASHLLLNRGAGLLWGWRQIHGLEPFIDADFLRRNYFKAVLALGDALLIAHKKYQTPYRGRDAVVAGLVIDPGAGIDRHLLDLYAEALRFKFTPDAAFPEKQAPIRFEELGHRWWAVFRHVEKIRTGRSFADPFAYRAWNGTRQPEEHRPRLLIRNLVQNLCRGVPSLRYARESLFRSLPVLLFRAQRGGKWWDRSSAWFMALWQRFN